MCFKTYGIVCESYESSPSPPKGPCARLSRACVCVLISLTPCCDEHDDMSTGAVIPMPRHPPAA